MTTEEEQKEAIEKLTAVIEDKEAVFWKDILKAETDVIDRFEKELKVHKAIKEMAEMKIAGLPNATYIG